MLYLVDDLYSLDAAGWPTGEYWSTSTGLPFLLPPGKQVDNPERLVDNDLFQAFGRAVLDVLSEARPHFREVEDLDYRFADFAVTYAGSFYLSLLCIGYKAMLLDRWLSHDPEIEKTVIGSPILTASGPGAFQFGRYNHIFTALAAILEKGSRYWRSHQSTVGNFRLIQQGTGLRQGLEYPQSNKCKLSV